MFKIYIYISIYMCVVNGVRIKVQWGQRGDVYFFIHICNVCICSNKHLQLMEFKTINKSQDIVLLHWVFSVRSKRSFQFVFLCAFFPVTSLQIPYSKCSHATTAQTLGEWTPMPTALIQAWTQEPDHCPWKLTSQF